MSGWIAVSRGIFDHEFFKPEPLSEREAWIWLCANAAWKDTTYRAGSDVLECPRGSLFVTLRRLATAWRWGSEKRVRGFLDRLENGRMIGRNSVGRGDAKRTHITICNYEVYQNAGRNSDASEGKKRAELGRTKEQENNSVPTERAPRAAEIRKQIFDLGKAMLRANGFKGDPGGMINKWLKTSPEADVLYAILNADGRNDPVPWVTATLARKQKDDRRTRSIDEDLAAQGIREHTFDDEDGERDSERGGHHRPAA